MAIICLHRYMPVAPPVCVSLSTRLACALAWGVCASHIICGQSLANYYLGSGNIPRRNGIIVGFSLDLEEHASVNWYCRDEPRQQKQHSLSIVWQSSDPKQKISWTFPWLLTHRGSSSSIHRSLTYCNNTFHSCPDYSSREVLIESTPPLV